MANPSKEVVAKEATQGDVDDRNSPAINLGLVEQVEFDKQEALADTTPVLYGHTVESDDKDLLSVHTEDSPEEVFNP
jgi:hypothetical protein